MREKIRRCLHCKDVIKIGIEDKYRLKNVCSAWCSDFLPKKNEFKTKCKYCDNITRKLKTKNGKSYASRRCEECYIKKVNKMYTRKSRAIKVWDNVGRTCCICKEYKLLDNFYNEKRNRLGKSYTCKICHIKLHNDYYKKNRLKINKYMVERYKTKKNNVNS